MRLKQVIVATAGHIDHGKTTLVKALTGVDTDRLPEEKARGISIDLGFAYRKTPPATPSASSTFPDTSASCATCSPAYAASITCMLIVAADDGVMPQTVEHLHIVDLLTIKRGIAVITKTDRVRAERVAEVAASVRSAARPTALARYRCAAGVRDQRRRYRQVARQCSAASAKEHRPARTRRAQFALCDRPRVYRRRQRHASLPAPYSTVRVAVGDKLMLSPERSRSARARHPERRPGGARRQLRANAAH